MYLKYQEGWVGGEARNQSEKARVVQLSTRQRHLHIVLTCIPATASSTQFCLLCCQPVPFPRILAARKSQLWLRGPCRLLAWPGQVINTSVQVLACSTTLQGLMSKHCDRKRFPAKRGSVAGRRATQFHNSLQRELARKDSGASSRPRHANTVGAARHASCAAGRHEAASGIAGAAKRRQALQGAAKRTVDCRRREAAP